MKNSLRLLFSFVLNRFESGTSQYSYQKSHRVILVVMGVLFSGLATFVINMASGQNIAYYFPAVVFGSIGLLGFVIGFLGNERAVATIWGNTE